MYYFCYSHVRSTTHVKDINLRDVVKDRKEALELIAYAEFDYLKIEGLENNLPFTLSILKARRKGLEDVNIVKFTQTTLEGFDKKPITSYMKLSEIEFGVFEEKHSDIFRKAKIQNALKAAA